MAEAAAAHLRQCRSVVYAIAHHRHPPPLLLQLLDQRRLARRLHAGIHILQPGSRIQILERRQPQYFCGSKHVTAAAKSYGGQHTSGAMPTAAAMAWAVAAWSPDSITALMPILCSAGCNRNATGEAVGRSFIQRADAAAAQVWLACLKHCSREQALLPTGAGKSLTLSC